MFRTSLCRDIKYERASQQYGKIAVVLLQIRSNTEREKVVLLLLVSSSLVTYAYVSVNHKTRAVGLTATCRSSYLIPSSSILIPR